MKHLLVFIGSIGIYWYLLLVSIVAPVYADELDFSVYPPITEIITSPSSTIKAPIKLANLTDAKQNISVTFKPFQSAAEDGTITFIQDNTLDPIKRFISLEKNDQRVKDSLIIRPNESADFELVIDIPSEALSKDYYFTLLFQTKNERSISQTGSKLEAGIGSNVLLSIRNPSDNNNPQTKLKEFSTKLIFEEKPINFTLRIENLGKHFIKAKGEIVITDVSGRQITKIEIPEQNILSESIRNLTKNLPSISSAGLLGKYTAKAVVDIGKEKALVDSITFYAVPKNSVILLLFILLVLILVIKRLNSYIKSRRFPQQINPNR